jgi:hypothetical protein
MIAVVQVGARDAVPLRWLRRYRYTWLFAGLLLLAATPRPGRQPGRRRSPPLAGRGRRLLPALGAAQTPPGRLPGLLPGRAAGTFEGDGAPHRPPDPSSPGLRRPPPGHVRPDAPPPGRAAGPGRRHAPLPDLPVHALPGDRPVGVPGGGDCCSFCWRGSSDTRVLPGWRCAFRYGSPPGRTPPTGPSRSSRVCWPSAPGAFSGRGWAWAVPPTSPPSTPTSSSPPSRRSSA